MQARHAVAPLFLLGSSCVMASLVMQDAAAALWGLAIACWTGATVLIVRRANAANAADRAPDSRS